MTSPVVLVPIDGQADAAMALPVARVLAGVSQARLLVVHVAPPGPATVVDAGSPRASPATIADLTVEQRVGEPAEQVLALAREVGAWMIVMCKHATGGAGQALGPTAMGVLHDAPCPVVLVPPRQGWAPWHLQHVLVPHDGTPTTSAALRPAAELAERAGAELLVEHVTGLAPAPSEAGSLTVFRYLDQPHHAWAVWSREFADRLACICPMGHLHVRVRLGRGDPAAKVLELARKQAMDLIVLAWRGRWEGHAATLKTVLREAECPVMALRASA